MWKWVKGLLTDLALLQLTQMAAAVLLMFAGNAYGQNLSLFVALLIVYLLVFLVIALVLTKKKDQLEEQAAQKAREQVSSDVEKERREFREKREDWERTRRALDQDIALASSAKDFLITRFQKTSSVMTDILEQPTGETPPPPHQKLKKLQIIEETLSALCHNLKESMAQSHQMSVSEVMFRSTYMEVDSVEHTHMLRYVAWSTPDGHKPRSLSERKMYRQGEGCAGIAWKRKRPVIEDQFKDGSEWMDNYEGQGALYQSMVSIPVTLGPSSGDEKVIGVITVDTNIKGLFGAKNNREDEGRTGQWIRPFAEYIAFVSAVDESIDRCAGGQCPFKSGITNQS